jgi:hypothetical protein
MAKRNSRGPSTRAFNGWTAARDIAEALKPLGSFETAIRALYQRLVVGLVNAASMHGAAANQAATPGPFLIPAAHWRDADGILVSDLWRTGQITIWSWWEPGSKNIQYDYFNVRFDPA